MRDIILPPVHNTRSPAQWEIISKHVDFEGKTVLDLGCGHGDLLWRAWRAGAKSLEGVEKKLETDREIYKRLMGDLNAACDNLYLMLEIENIIRATRQRGHYDVVICFSVLPYLQDPFTCLCWICDHSEQALIECQYSGDGPGFDWLKDDDDMRDWLEQAGFETVEPIGKTLVKDRDKYRTIWLCQ